MDNLTPPEAFVAQQIRRILLIDGGYLLKRPLRKDPRNPYAGYCYVASEAFCHAMGPTYKPMHLRWEGTSHWFVRAPDGRFLDLTAEQFKSRPNHAAGKGKGFLTKDPSERALTLLSLAGLLHRLP